jgi:hypothetical protein
MTVMTLIIPLGFEPDLSPAERLLLAMLLLAFLGVAALPASAVLAAVGAARARRAGRSPAWAAGWYWLWGTALTSASIAGCFEVGIGWLSVPLGWLPGLAVAAALRPPRQLGWQDAPRPVEQR